MIERPTRVRHTTPAARLLAVITASAVAVASAPVHAQQPARGLPLIRDTEIEQLLRDYTQPILRAAKLAQQNIQIVIINDRTFNAFVVDGRRIFVNSGALMESQTPNQIIGVLAHETGHIAGGHLLRLREQLASAQTASILAMLLGVGAIVAGAKSGAAGAGDMGMAAIAAPQEAIRRSLLSYVRTQEEAADRAGVKFLDATGQSAKGMYETFKRFAEQTMFISRAMDPYAQSHPMPTDRVSALSDLARTSPNWERKDSPELQLRHDLMRAKLSGFMERPDTIVRRYPPSDVSLPARYARAIASYRHGDVRTAIGQIDALIQAQPNNPYFHELKGQALLEAGRGVEAIAPLRRAVQLSPQPALIQVMLGQALLASNDAKLADEAVAILRTALVREPEVPEGYSHLAMAYGRKGDLAQADLASAQAALARGDVKTARELAARAKTRFAVGTPGWVRADDIISAKPPSVQRRN
jgi:predicted Zn-dependent protease